MTLIFLEHQRKRIQARHTNGRGIINPLQAPARDAPFAVSQNEARHKSVVPSATAR